MIGLVIVTYGRLAVEFRSALEHVVGPQSQLEAICIGLNDDDVASRERILEAVERVDSGGGVAILTDMFEQTPSNLAISMMNGRNVEILAGVNLPMLVKLAQVRRKCALAEATTAAEQAGRTYILSAAALLKRTTAPSGGHEAVR
jgi:PTS system mannose-specific IIA component